ncbi:type IA DNA topoisomerase [Fusobacterium sp. FSA-380-WT-2B]|uniref:type IA DNA topoisomerase n=1 Tax=Fusobacterium sp. FSA-380-WT-2B TaxID=2605786 RepID=UPI0012B1EC7D|nr:type IA DNA topoisomerase [Fusobacterium sp. FSA-380-WT-2B]MSS61500.1 DNA topoisomerase [Fusobacterium sp. FSA-380-WT-2B]
MKLIICEKGTLGKNVAKAIGIEDVKEGYYICKNDYIVTWASGHIFSLYDVDDYLGEKKSWRDTPLPFIPKVFKYKLTKTKNFEVMKKILKDYPIEMIINSGDSDREGQIIVDIILNQLSWSGEVKRLWIPEQTKETIQKELLNLKDNREYINLANEGYARSFMDWLLGINLTRYLTNKAGIKLNVGRVMIPIIKYIYDRDNSIKNFIKTKYYQAESEIEKDGISLTLTSEKKFDTKDKCLEYIKSLSNIGKIENIEKKEIKKTPKKLFSLSKLQAELSERYKMSFKTSMDIIQNLYESGYITYPRTNTEYLSENEKGRIKEIIDKIEGFNLELKDTKRIFDNTKIESHSAITPTINIPKNLTPEEDKVYNTIFSRFISNFLVDETLIEKITITIQAGIETFKLSGETIIKEGFLKYEPEKIENQLPKFEENEELKLNFEAIEKETQPPKKVTEKELSNYLKNPFRKEKETEDEEYKAILQGIEIGTEATRTETIEKCKHENYISQKGTAYSIEPLGEKLIVILDKLKVNLYKEKTVEFSEMQKKVFKGIVKVEDLLELIKEELENIIGADIEVEKIKIEKESIGTCPRCGRSLYENEKSFYCSGYSDKENPCAFSIWKEQKYPAIKLNKSNVINLLKGKTITIKNIKKKDGTEFDGVFKLVDDGKYVNLKLITNEDKDEIGKCPRCGNKVIENIKSYNCINKECHLTIWKEQKYPPVKLSKTNIKSLLSGKEILIKNLINKDGKEYEAYFILNDDGKYVSLKLNRFNNPNKK